MRITLSDQDKTIFKVTGVVLGVTIVAILLYVLLPGVFSDGSLQSLILFFVPALVLYLYAYELARKEDYLGLKVFFIFMLVLDFLVLIYERTL